MGWPSLTIRVRDTDGHRHHARRWRAKVRGERRPGRLPDLGQPGAVVAGDLYELCADELLDELDGGHDVEKISSRIEDELDDCVPCWSMAKMHADVINADVE
jgi:hypothetical protein